MYWVEMYMYHLTTDTDSGLLNVLCYIKHKTMDNVQDYDSCSMLPYLKTCPYINHNNILKGNFLKKGLNGSCTRRNSVFASCKWDCDL
jgi:hypothetical protein